MGEVVKKYRKGKVTIVWKPGLCIHSGVCFKGLPEVFNPSNKPWVTSEGATEEQIMEQVSKCPSGALSYELEKEEGASDEIADVKVVIASKGPLLIHGSITLTHLDGKEEKKENITALCRCGLSKNKPFCDGGHKKSDVLD